MPTEQNAEIERLLHGKTEAEFAAALMRPEGICRAWPTSSKCCAQRQEDR